MADTTKDVSELVKSLKKLNKAYSSLDAPEYVRSGSVVLDALLGGGIPRGVFILWSAENGCGKSTGCLHVSRSYCIQGLKVLYLDFEHGVNDKQIDGMGLRGYLYNENTNPNGSFILYQVQTYKDAETILDSIMSDVDLVIIDSMTSILTEKVKGSSSEDVLPGIDARVSSTFMKKYKAEASRNRVTWIMINQIRTHIGMSFGQQTYDDEAGGQALKFYPDIRLRMKKAFKGELRRKEDTALGSKEVDFGMICEIKAVKNRYERPNIPLLIAILFGKGIGNEYAYYDWLEARGDVVKSGSWYEIKFKSYNEKMQGMNNVVKWIGEHKAEVTSYIQESGGYKLLINNENTIDIGGSNNCIYDESILVPEDIISSSEDEES